MQYTGSGKIKIGGCAESRYVYCYRLKFGINVSAWFKPAALKGRLERIVVKEVKMISPYHFLYTDSFNALYNEEELITYQEALDIIALRSMPMGAAQITPMGVAPMAHMSITNLFSIGDVVYFVDAAKKGVLEPHAIEDILMKLDNIMYMDSYNAYFNEDELCTKDDAVELAKTFYENQVIALEKELHLSACE